MLEVHRALDEPGNQTRDLTAVSLPIHRGENLGPVPAELRGHAEYVLQEQRAAAARLADARSTVARHLAALSSVPAAAPQSAGRLDTTG